MGVPVDAMAGTCVVVVGAAVEVVVMAGGFVVVALVVIGASVEVAGDAEVRGAALVVVVMRSTAIVDWISVASSDGVVLAFTAAMVTIEAFDGGADPYEKLAHPRLIARVQLRAFRSSAGTHSRADGGLPIADFESQPMGNIRPRPHLHRNTRKGWHGYKLHN